MRAALIFSSTSHSINVQKVRVPLGSSIGPVAQGLPFFANRALV